MVVICIILLQKDFSEFLFVWVTHVFIHDNCMNGPDGVWWCSEAFGINLVSKEHNLSTNGEVIELLCVTSAKFCVK